MILCTFAIFCTLSPHSSTSLLPSGSLLAPGGGEETLISINGGKESSSAKSGQWGILTKRRNLLGR